MKTTSTAVALALVLACAGRPASQPSAPSLGVKGSQFVVSGQPQFLLGVSVFDALGGTPPRDADLDALRAWGIGLVRVWAHWTAPIYAADGTLSRIGRQRLENLVGRLEQRGLLLELVTLRPGQLQGQRFALFASADARLRAVQELTSALKPHRGVLFDLYNEHDHPDGAVSHAELRRLREAVKAIDADRIVTVSSTEHHFLTAQSALDETGRKNLRDEVMDVGVDLLAAHLPRTADWGERTAARVRVLRDAVRAAGRDLPIHLNEEQRERPDGAIVARTYARALAGAREAGAAGWVFHTAAGYDLARKPFAEALSTREIEALKLLKKAR